MVSTFGLPVRVVVTVGPAKFWQAHALAKDDAKLASEPLALVSLRNELRASASRSFENTAASGAASLALKPELAVAVTVAVAAGTVMTSLSVKYCVEYVVQKVLCNNEQRRLSHTDQKSYLAGVLVTVTVVFGYVIYA